MRQSILTFLLGAALLVLRTVYAAPHTVTRDELAKQLAYYRKIAQLHTRFHETKTLKDIGMKIESDGELTVIRPSKVIWKVTSPSPLTVTLERGRVQIAGQNGKSESYAIEGAARDSLKALVAWLKLDPDELMQSYRITQSADGSYRFEPKADAPVQAMQMYLKPGSYLERLQIEEKSGDMLSIRFEKPRLEEKKPNA